MKGRLFLYVASVFAVSLVALQVSYPVSTYLRYFSFPWWNTLLSYFCTAAVLTFETVLSILLFVKVLFSKDLVLAAAMAGITSFIVAAVISILFGPVGFDLPGLWIRGIFFAEFEFVRFIFFVALPVCLFATVAFIFIETREKKSVGA